MSDETGERPPFYRRRYLINPRFQLKYTAVFLILASLVAGILGYLLYQTVRENSQLLAMDNSDVNEAVQNLLRDQDVIVLYRIFALLGAMVGAITLVGVFVTHQIAGPALVLTRSLKEMAEGRLPRLRPLRKNDELLDLFEALHAVVARVNLQTQSDIVLLERTKEALRSAEREDLVHELDDVLRRLRALAPPEPIDTT